MISYDPAGAVKNSLLYRLEPQSATGTEPVTAHPYFKAVFSIQAYVAEVSSGSAASGFIVKPAEKNSGRTTMSGLSGTLPEKSPAITPSKAFIFVSGFSHSGENSTKATLSLSVVIGNRLSYIPPWKSPVFYPGPFLRFPVRTVLFQKLAQIEPDGHHLLETGI